MSGYQYSTAYRYEHDGGAYGQQQQPYHDVADDLSNPDGSVVGSSSSSGSATGSNTTSGGAEGVDSDSFDDPRIADLPRILLMGPRRGGKTSIQRVVFQKMSPHETLFRLEATQNLERFVVDHTPLCRFTIWDFPGDYYGGIQQQHEEEEEKDKYRAAHGEQQHQYGGYAVAGTSPDSGMLADGDIGSNNPYGADAAQQQQHHIGPLQRQPHVGGDVSDAMDGNQHVAGEGSGQQEVGEAAPSERGKVDGDDGDSYVFGRATALIFVIDAQDEPYDHVLQNFTETVTRAIRANPHIAIEVFINKVDGELFLSDEAKYDCRRDVMQQVSDELADAGVPPDSVPISYHLTSIYDHSVFEAFSRVVQKLIPQLPTLENLLNVLVSTCSMEKAYLFDVASKLYISTDSSPVDMQSVELCSDMIDVVLDVSGIYGLRGEDMVGDVDTPAGEGEGASLATPTGTAALTAVTGDLDSLATDPLREAVLSESNQVEDGEMSHAMGEQQSYVTGEDSAIIDVGKGDNIEESNDELVGTLISQRVSVGGNVEVRGEKDKQHDDSDSAYDSESSSVIRLSNGMVLYLKEVDTMLALVCLTRAGNFRKKSLINYNISCLKRALRALIQPMPSNTKES